MIKTLYSQIKEYKKASILTPVFIVLEVIMDVLIPYVTASLIDKGISAGNMQNVYFYGFVMIIMACVSLLFGILAGRMSAYASTGFAANLRSAMYKNIQTFSFADIDRFSTSGLVTRMTTDVSNLQNAYQQILRVTVRAPFRLILSICMCLFIDARLSVIFILAMVILSFSLYHIISRVARMFQKVFEQYDELNLKVQENVQAIRVVKAFVREKYENEKFAKAAEGLYWLYVRAESLMALNHPIMNMVVYGCMIALSWFGAHYIVEGTLTTGELTSLFTYVMSILMSLMMLSMVFIMLTQSAASGRRVTEVINLKTDITNPENPVTVVADGSIEFRDVRFDYSVNDSPSPATGSHQSKRSALYNVSFRIESGQTIGIIGGTGSGKSTLVNLISRLYDVTKGQVMVGGCDVREYDIHTLRNAVSVVLQQNTLFSGTILENLRWGNEHATLEDCREACKIAQADDFIMEKPDGYETRIEQGGTNISGGQKQRLCIARALLKHPRILILDDATSACDTATDAKIRMAFRKQLPEMTQLIIAQRILSVKDCDKIIVMDNGMVTGFGTHETLMKTNDLYREICEIQNKDIGDFDKKGGNA